MTLINQAAPGMIKIGSSGTGVISEQTLTSVNETLGWTSVIAAIGLAWTAISWLYYTRQAVRAMFDLGYDERNFFLQKLTDLGLVIEFGLILLAATALSLLTTEATRPLLDALGHDSVASLIATRTVGFAAPVAMNFGALLALILALIRVLSRVRAPWRSMWPGALGGAVTLCVVSALSGILLRAASRDPLLVTFAVLIGLLLWFTLICRIILLSAAWIAVEMADEGIVVSTRTADQVAYEEALAIRSARLLLARHSVRSAEGDVQAAHGLARWAAAHRLNIAREALTSVESSPVPLPPKKHNWWTEEEAEPVASALEPPHRTSGRRSSLRGGRR